MDTDFSSQCAPHDICLTNYVLDPEVFVIYCYTMHSASHDVLAAVGAPAT